uniref:Uncharacterized protein n=1 Tax=Timema bartmani TaxID=61472 RepID=A0A7R9EPA8_9NEOP|nr:unnamed protein product [Timema bartmani]
MKIMAPSKEYGKYFNRTNKTNFPDVIGPYRQPLKNNKSRFETSRPHRFINNTKMIPLPLEVSQSITMDLGNMHIASSFGYQHQIELKQPQPSPQINSSETVLPDQYLSCRFQGSLGQHQKQPLLQQHQQVTLKQHQQTQVQQHHKPHPHQLQLQQYHQPQQQQKHHLQLHQINHQHYQHQQQQQIYPDVRPQGYTARFQEPPRFQHPGYCQQPLNYNQPKTQHVWPQRQHQEYNPGWNNGYAPNLFGYQPAAATSFQVDANQNPLFIDYQYRKPTMIEQTRPQPYVIRANHGNVNQRNSPPPYPSGNSVQMSSQNTTFDHDLGQNFNYVQELNNTGVTESDMKSLVDSLPNIKDEEINTEYTWFTPQTAMGAAAPVAPVVAPVPMVPVVSVEDDAPYELIIESSVRVLIASQIYFGNDEDWSWNFWNSDHETTKFDYSCRS